MTPLPIKKIKSFVHNQRGTYLIFSALVVFILFGFATFGIEVGRWYAIQSEMGKAIDGAAFAGAKNVSNPAFGNQADLREFVRQVAAANFPDGLLGTDTPTFNINIDGQGKVLVQGSTNSLNVLADVFDGDHSKTHIPAQGVAKLRKAEVALVLDISGSMSGAISDLKTGATTFVKNFEDFERDHQFALVTFAAGVQVREPLRHYYVDPITSAISGLGARGWTNTEDALAQTNALSWSDQSGLTANERARQVVIFFSDGNPTAFRGKFTWQGNDYDGVVSVNENANVGINLFRPTSQSTTFPLSGLSYQPPVGMLTTGDGQSAGSGDCAGNTARWDIFNHSDYGLASYGAPMDAYDSEACNIPQSDLGPYGRWLVVQMALGNAATLKSKDIEIFTIGLGDVDQAFLEQIATNADHAYYTADSSGLDPIFQAIANRLKLVLIS